GRVGKLEVHDRAQPLLVGPQRLSPRGRDAVTRGRRAALELLVHAQVAGCFQLGGVARDVASRQPRYVLEEAELDALGAGKNAEDRQARGLMHQAVELEVRARRRRGLAHASPSLNSARRRRTSRYSWC